MAEPFTEEMFPEDTYVPPSKDDLERFERERLQAMEDALARAQEEVGPPTHYANGHAVPDAIPMTPEERAQFFIPKERSLAQMLLRQGAPSEEERWACQGAWKPGALTLVVGAQQSFKSWAMLDLMLSASKGQDWLGRALCEYDAIVYLSNEKSKSAVYERLWLLFEDELPSADHVFVYHREDRIQFGNENWREWVRWMHEDLPGDRVLVILDTLTSLAPAGYDENSLTHVSQVLHHIRELQQGSRMDIMLVHHLNATGERPRGHTALDGEVDGFVKFDRRGQDATDVVIKFEPKDGVPSVQTYTFDPMKGLFKRAPAKMLHVGNISSVIQWFQDKNGGEGLGLSELRDKHFPNYRIGAVKAEVDKAVDDLVLRMEHRRSRLTNRVGDIITVMPEDERRHILEERRALQRIEAESAARVDAEIRARDMLERRGDRALGAMPNG